jgi:hypothetical protein
MSRQSPECFVSPVSGSPDGRLSTLSYWRISPPLIRKILAIRPKIIVSHFYFFVEMGPVMWTYENNPLLEGRWRLQRGSKNIDGRLYTFTALRETSRANAAAST